MLNFLRRKKASSTGRVIIRDVQDDDFLLLFHPDHRLIVETIRDMGGTGQHDLFGVENSEWRYIDPTTFAKLKQYLVMSGGAGGGCVPSQSFYSAGATSLLMSEHYPGAPEQYLVRVR